MKPHILEEITLPIIPPKYSEGGSEGLLNYFISFFIFNFVKIVGVVALF